MARNPRDNYRNGSFQYILAVVLGHMQPILFVCFRIKDRLTINKKLRITAAMNGSTGIITAIRGECRSWVRLMKKVILSLVVSLGVTGVAFAKGDANAGKAKVATCTACHGATGVSLAPNYPNLAGQGERYLIKQISEIKAGNRKVPEMTPFVGSLSEKDIADIAAFYASQPAPQGAADPKLVDLGEKLYRFGDQKKGIPACSACHSPTGKGNSLAGFPQIAGQHPQYTAKQLRDFREGDRVNDGDSMTMRTIAEKLSNKEVEALSSYISGLR